MIPRWDRWESRGVIHPSVTSLHVEQSGSQRAFAARAVVTGNSHSKSLCCGTILQLALTFSLSSVSVPCIFCRRAAAGRGTGDAPSHLEPEQFIQPKAGSGGLRQWEDTRKTVCPLLTWPTFLHLGWPAWPPCSYHKFGLGSISIFNFFSLKCNIFLFWNGDWWKPLLFLFFLSMNWSDDNRVSTKL